MNITAQALVFAVASVATAAAIGIGMADISAQPTQAANEIVKLERVVVVGKRTETQVAEIAQLPRVVITGHRVSEAEAQQMALASNPDSKTL